MTTLPNMGLTLPTQGASGAGTWDDALDANSALIDAHDHSPGKGTTIKTNGIEINADLTFASLYAPINLHRLTFASIAALTSNNKSLFVSSSDNELYWRSNAGANVKLTSGSQLNVAAFTGGIGGDYAAVSALVDFDDATDTYRFRQETAASVRQFAKVKFADISLVEYDPSGDASVPTNSITIKSPDALAGNYSLTMPAALPGSTSLVQLDSSGVLTASNTVANALTLSSALGAAAVTASGLITANAGVTVPTGQALTVSGTGTLSVGGASTQAAVTASGLITANAGVTAGANQHVTVSGTGIFKHGTKTLSIHGVAFQGSVGYSSTQGVRISSVVGATVFAPIMLPVGCRILAVRAFIRDNSTGPTKLQMGLFALNSAGVSTSSLSSVSSGAGADQTLTVSTSTTIASSTAFMIQLAITTGTDECSGYCAEVDYDQQ